MGLGWAVAVGHTSRSVAVSAGHVLGESVVQLEVTYLVNKITSIESNLPRMPGRNAGRRKSPSCPIPICFFSTPEE